MLQWKPYLHFGRGIHDRFDYFDRGIHDRFDYLSCMLLITFVNYIRYQMSHRIYQISMTKFLIVQISCI